MVLDIALQVLEFHVQAVEKLRALLGEGVEQGRVNAELWGGRRRISRRHKRRAIAKRSGLQGVPCCGVKLAGDGHGCLRCRVDLCALYRAIDRRSIDVGWLHVALDGAASGGDVDKHVLEPLVVRRGSRASWTGTSGA